MFKVILSALIVCLLFLGVFYLKQRQYIYLPKPGNIQPITWGVPGTRLIKLKTSDNLSLNAWYHPSANRKMPTILYLQGNYGHFGHRAARIKPYINAGYGVLLLGYRGYSGSEGQPSEKGLYIDARTAIGFLNAQNIPMRCVVLFGESLGTGVAAQMATEFHVGAVVLQSAYTSMVDVGKKHYPFLPVRWLLRDRYESIKKIQQLHAPLLMLHGKMDEVIPLAFGQQLYNHALQPKIIYIYPRAGHNDLPDVSLTVMRFLQQHHVCF